ncbi:helix-turn-helix domain-containing protein [Agrobacterium tumefaciens]|uniref:helix-turn-helix domain-containing protein n=1 Tax=Agrobacterium tumefaciens TaxID=358 RepID=UPI002244F0EE|nr:AraC family transcriptional regulator [Agrobacterium tumefaciens]MCW8060421.1 AraC family transcriptional regulator [Agrobacterium tumefaciens]MCW8145865.1 AraC family transcriptional regulator [Agrobacterium tumefaciens]
MITARPNKWGSRIELEDASLACTHADPNSVHYKLSTHAILVFFTTEPQWQIALNSDQKRTGIAPAGSIEIVPAQSEVIARWAAYKHSLRLDISPGRLQRLAGMEFGKDTFELHPSVIGVIDDKAHTLGRWIRSEMQNEYLMSKDALDSLTTYFAIHLLRNYSSLGIRSSFRINGGLTPRVWRTVNDFIQAHLAEPLSLERLATIAQISPTHFGRAFKQTTGQTPRQFVITARLAYARNLIETTDLPMGMIARSAGFSSNSHMTATMNRLWNVTPRQLTK